MQTGLQVPYCDILLTFNTGRLTENSRFGRDTLSANSEVGASRAAIISHSKLCMEDRPQNQSLQLKQNHRKSHPQLNLPNI